MSLQTVTRQVLKRVLLIVGNDNNWARVVRGVISRDFPGFVPVECPDAETAHEALVDLECDAVAVSIDARMLVQSAFWQNLPDQTPVILFSHAIETTRPVVAREARVQSILDAQRPRTDIFSEQLRHALIARANRLFSEFKHNVSQFSGDTFADQVEHLLLLHPRSVSLRRDVHPMILGQLKADPGSVRLAQLLVDNIRQLDMLAGVEPAELWDGALACVSMGQWEVAKQLLQTLAQKDLAWKPKAYEQLIEIAVKQNDMAARRKLGLQLADFYESSGDFRGMASVFEALNLHVKLSLDESYKLLKAWHSVGEYAKAAHLLVQLLEQCFKEQRFPELYLRLHILFGGTSEVARFLASEPQACAGKDEFWITLAEYFLHRGESEAARGYFNLISEETVALNQIKVLNLACHFELAKQGAPASEIYRRLVRVNDNVSIY